MGGKDFRRRRGWMISLGIVDVVVAELVTEWSDWERDRGRGGECGRCVGDSTTAGIFFDAAVDGLISWPGEGARLIEADWIVEASSEATFDAIVQEVSTGT